jgi:hypothetical protein
VFSWRRKQGVLSGSLLFIWTRQNPRNFDSLSHPKSLPKPPLTVPLLARLAAQRGFAASGHLMQKLNAES